MRYQARLATCPGVALSCRPLDRDLSLLSEHRLQCIVDPDPDYREVCHSTTPRKRCLQCRDHQSVRWCGKNLVSESGMSQGRSDRRICGAAKHNSYTTLHSPSRRRGDVAFKSAANLRPPELRHKERHSSDISIPRHLLACSTSA